MSNENKTNNNENDAEFEDIIEDDKDKGDIGAENDIMDKKNIKKKKSFKNKVILIETIIIIIISAVVYLYYNNQSQKINEIKVSSEKLNILNRELDKCQDLITEDQVNPDEYNYCNLLLRKFK